MGLAGPAAALAGYEVVTREWTIGTGNGMGLSADCPAQKKPIAGGWQTNTISGTAVHIAGSFPQYYPDFAVSRWLVTLNKPGPTTAMWVYAICAE